MSMADTITGSQEMKKTLLTTKLTGLTAGTSAESTAWTWSASRPPQSMSWSRSSSRTTTYPTSGHQEDFATSRDVIGKTSNPQQSTDGFGPDLVWRWHPPTQLLQVGATNHGPSQVIKPNLSHITCHNPITLSLTSMAAWRLAWEFSMTFTMMASNGMTLLATIPNLSSVRTPTNFLNMFRLWTQILNLDQKLLEA